VRLTQFGIQNNPQEWRLYYNLGFIYYMDLKNYAAAADAFNRGSQIPDAHPFMRILAARMAEHAGELETARMLWTATYQTTQNKDIRANAAAHLRALKVDDDVTHLEALVDQFRERTGRNPSSFAELQIPGLNGGSPADPLGDAYKLMPDGRVEVHNPDDFPFVLKGTPPGYIPPKAPKFLPRD
jgi:tetratricopeptide (TPR) repeat protein